MNEEHFTFHLQYQHSGTFANRDNRKWEEFFYSQNPKMCGPILVTPLKMQPHYSQSSRENATPSSGTLDYEQSLFGQSSLSSAGLERANWPRIPLGFRSLRTISFLPRAFLARETILRDCWQSSGTSPLAFDKEVPPPGSRHS